MRWLVNRRSVVGVLLPCFLVWGFVTCQAQDSDVLSVESVSARHGVYFSDINDFVEDNLGFIWFATQDGIARFDGYEFEFFRHDVSDTTSISHHHVSILAEDLNGDVWAGSSHGISKFDRRTGSFKRYYNSPRTKSSKGSDNVREMAFDRHGTMWSSGGSRLLQLDSDSEDFVRVNGVGTPMEGAQVRELYRDIDGDMWCGSTRGLFKIERLGEEYQFEKISETVFHAFASLASGHLICASNSGVWIMDKARKEFVQMSLPEDLKASSIGRIAVDKNQKIWISYTNGEVVMTDSDGNVVKQYGSLEPTNSIAPRGRVLDILEDSQGVMWFITQREIFKHVPGYPRFKTLFRNNSKSQVNTIERVIASKDGSIWSVTNDRVLRSLPNGDLREYTLGDNLPVGDGLVEDHLGQVWVNALGVGFYRWNADSDAFMPAVIDGKLGRTLIYQIVKDKTDDHVAWAGTRYGLVKVDFKSSSTGWFDPKNDIEGQPTARVAVFDDRNPDELWCYNTYYNSISKFDKSTEKFYSLRPTLEQQYVLEGDVKDMTITNDGTVWIATLFGLTRFEPVDSTFTFYTTRDGLTRNGAVSIMHSDSLLWLAGDQFLASMRLDDQAIENYAISHASGFFFTKSACIDREGNIVFGAADGAVRISPADAPLITEAPKVYITALRINDTTRIGTTVRSDVPLEFTYDQNEIAFEFTGLNSIDPQNNQYKCKLTGYDDEWRLLNDQRSVRYTNLKHGDYVFNVLASNGHDEWSDEPAQVSLSIAPAYWETNWFKGLIIAVIGLLIYLIMLVRQRQVTLQKERDLAEKSARYKSNFLANVSHEIRTPMNAILGMTELALDSNTNEERTEYLNTIQNASSDLLQILNELLDHSKLESGTFNFELRDFELDHVLNQLRVVFQAIAQRKGLVFQLANTTNGLILNGDPVRLKQILTNLLSNAMKYTSEGTVELNITELSAEPESIDLRFQVIDSGKGIPSDKLARVFDRFESGELEMEDSSASTGLGLYITKQLVDRQGGNIRMISEQDKGTKAIVDLHFRKGKDVRPTADNHISTEALPSELKVLIAEDSPVNQMLLSKLLESQIPGIQITVADNGLKAIEEVEAHDFDVVFMDIKMPELNGYQATRAIRVLSDPSKNSIPVIGVTASAMPEQIQECLDSGMTGVVTKPIDKAKLIEKLAEAIKTTFV